MEPVSTLVVFAGILLSTSPSMCGDILPKPNIYGPPLPHKPFVVAWNVASQHCPEKFGVQLNLSYFDIVHNEDDGWKGDSMVIFYSNELGLYPYIDSQNNSFNGGIPQLGDLYAHLTKAKQDIIEIIPDLEFRGLAVIDWEAWNPIWNRMHSGVKRIYQDASIKLVEKEHPDWPKEKVLAEAKSQFESAAQGFITFTLALAKTVRPKALWGFYRYPDCYNYNTSGDKTTLQCSNQTIQYDDDIQYVFDESTALYPSVYLSQAFGDHHNAVYYVANRVLEAVRVDSQRSSDISAPIFPYHSITYRKETQYLDVYDLRNSIGVASVLGSSGMVIWGNYPIAQTKNECLVLNDYISNVLGPYVKMTTDYAFQCSLSHCSGNGRCVLTNYPSEKYRLEKRYLTANDALDVIEKFDKMVYKIFDEVIRDDKDEPKYSILCQCYYRWSGNACDHPQ